MSTVSFEFQNLFIRCLERRPIRETNNHFSLRRAKYLMNNTNLVNLSY